AAEEALRDATLQLHVVADGWLDHHHAARVDHEPLSRGEVEVEEVAASVQPDRALALEPLEEEALAPARDAHAQPLRERALDLDLADMTEIGVLLADDLALQLVLADGAGERAGDADRACSVRDVAGEEKALAREQLALQPPHQATGHLDVHRDVAGDEHHRARLGGESLA